MEQIIIEETEVKKPKSQEDEINLLEIIKKLWRKRKFIGIWCGAAALVGIIVAFSIPKEYTTNVKLAPESFEGNTSRTFSALASIAGVNLGNSGKDAVYPELYPDVVSSVPFSLDLLNIPLTDKSGERRMTLQEYLENDLKSPWWSVILGIPGKILNAILPAPPADDNTVSDNTSAPIRITKDQSRLIKQIKRAIEVSVDQKTSIVTIDVTLQDPVVSAIVADSVANRLKEYITNYRTNKSRTDLDYIAKLNEDARVAYYNAQQKYANYLDTHQGIVLYSAQTMRDRLENEATLAFNIFNQTSQQLQLAKAKVQEQTPVYATIDPAIIPIIPSAPGKVRILIIFTFLGFMFASLWILFIKPFIKNFKSDNKDPESSAVSPESAETSESPECSDIRIEIEE